MSGKGQYNVLVDMDDSAYTQPATIESDGLEFQDFSTGSGTHNSAPPPPPAAPRNTTSFFDTDPQPRHGGQGKPVWSLDYYAQYFDVDTSQVLERCMKTLYPVGDFANDTLNNRPDLYGPFWISTTVVFVLFVCSSLAGSLGAHIGGTPYQSDFRLLSFAVGVVYSYGFVMPALVWLATKYFGCQPSLLEIVNYYGYALVVWVPVSKMSSRRQQKIQERQQKEAAQRKQNAKTYINQVPFRFAERNFKSRVPPPDFSNVIDLHTHGTDNRVRQVQLNCPLNHLLFKENQQAAYILDDFPGLIFIPNPFQDAGQRRLIRECLEEYTKAPNISNLDTHYEIPPQGLWAAACSQTVRGEMSLNDVVPRKSDKVWQEEANQYEKRDPPPVETVPLLPPQELMRKMRWVMLGYQYHWPTKSYHLDRRYPMPTVVDRLAKTIAVSIEGVGQEGVWKNNYKGQDYKAEAGVLNLYQYKDTLMGHVDKSEFNMDAPLISVR
ncbi:hypothetical protein BX666DRAFT_2017334 [Dichotomocladium elegans]|nr:hypothetical protein BX666DRAFT_2017334 [Dichotomocladium elegans]